MAEMDESGARGAHQPIRQSYSVSALEFITFTNPQLARTRRNQQIVRRQASRHVHRRSEPLQRRNEAELDISPLTQMSARSHQAHFNIEQDETNRFQSIGGELSPNIPTSFSVSRMDPFFSYPITMGHRERELYNHLYDGNCIMFRTMRDVGFLNRVRHTAAFRQLLAMSSWDISHLTCSPRSAEYLGHSVSATQELQSQINDSRRCSTDDAIGAVLTFACGANLLHDPESLRVHLDGLKVILDQRGGVQTLESSPLLRIMLYWVDINGAYFQDVAPRFPPPEHLLPRLNYQLQGQVLQTITVPAASDWISQVCSELRHVQNIIHSELQNRDLWQDTLFPGFYISPILGDLLTTQMETGQGPNNDNLTLEAFRLAAILYTSKLRAKFGVDTLAGEYRYATKLRVILSSFHNTQILPSPLLPWVLSVACTSHCDQDQSSWFRQSLTSALNGLDVRGFTDLQVMLQQILWDTELLSGQSQVLRDILAADDQIMPQE